MKDIIRAFHARDEVSFRRAVLEVVEEEEARHHFALARDMRGLLAAGGGDSVVSGLTMPMPDPPKARDGEWNLIEVREASLRYEDLVLEPDIADLLQGFGSEVSHWESLDSAGVSRRQKLLFSGPAGTGKTSAAEALASDLGWPLAMVSVESVVSSYLGETASNLRRVFDFAASHRVVLVFDEFDALGRMRDDSSEHGEMKRVVSSFLQFLERYNGPSVIIAITNHPDLLDFALWRRFDEVASFRLPGVHAIRRLLRLRSRPMKSRPFDIDATASQLKGLPHAAVEKFVVDLRRAQIVSGSETLSAANVAACLRSIRVRRW